MSHHDRHTHHAIDYIEITVADVGAAKRFYAGAFGWTFQDYGPEQGVHARASRARRSPPS